MQAIQIGAAKVLSMLLMIADVLQQHVHGSSFGLNDKEVWFVPKLFVSSSSSYSFSFTFFFLLFCVLKGRKIKFFLLHLTCECNLFYQLFLILI